ncbi:MAG: carbon-nitrogen hydrolase family protein [Helicobacter sp.]|nr:carbon-nitrogen hydrolase family protein [Helicobacter sp.]
MTLAIIQSQNISLEDVKSQLKHLKSGTLVIFNDYALDPFYTELNFNAENAILKLNALKKLAKVHNLHLLIPLILPDPQNRALKKLALIKPKEVAFYPQQKLINYPHWDEQSFFANIDNNVPPLIFSKNGIKFGAIFGYEVHFDSIFALLNAQNVDVVIMCSACAFNSFERWLMIAKTRAFCNSMMLIQANCVGDFKLVNRNERFYGKSFVLKADGEILEMLDSRPSMLCFDIKKSDITNMAKEWRFRNISKRENPKREDKGSR